MKTLLIALLILPLSALAGTNYQDSISLSGTITTAGVTNTALTASRAVVTDANKAEISSATTAAELAFVSGVTSAIQTQLNAKGAGTVTSVNIITPSWLTVSGGPVTSSGSITLAGNGTTVPHDSLSITNNGAFNTLNTTNRITGPLLEALDGSGANAAGTKTAFAGGNSTGTGAGGAAVIRTAFSGSSGSSTNALVDRIHVSAHQVSLTHATATLICNVSVASGKSFGLVVRANTTANGTGDIQNLMVTYSVSAVNKAGTVTANAITFAGGTTAAVSSGTLTSPVTAVVNGNSVDIKVNATSSLTSPSYLCGYIIEVIYTDDTGLTITDQ